ncbi:hypothetical protein DL96DRAFT_1619014 [Flagelloscypha sp. PMI_526]|nr:hypothetical protein DL96DRAFT_1619014 [Flagelloscypha sp. PMI_526]
MAAPAFAIPELVELTTSFITDDLTLHSTSLVSRVFVEPSQRALFSIVSLPEGDDYRAVRLLAVLDDDLANIFEMLSTVRHLRLEDFTEKTVSVEVHRPSLHALAQFIVPGLVTMDVQSGWITDFFSDVVMRRCSSSLKRLNMRLTKTDEESLVIPNKSTYNLQGLEWFSFSYLCLSNGDTAQIFYWLESGCFPNLTTLHICGDSSEYRGWCPLELMERVLRPIYTNLVCLVIDAWKQDLDEDESNNPFLLARFPKLRYFRMGFIHPYSYNFKDLASIPQNSSRYSQTNYPGFLGGSPRPKHSRPVHLDLFHPKSRIDQKEQLPGEVLERWNRLDDHFCMPVQSKGQRKIVRELLRTDLGMVCLVQKGMEEYYEWLGVLPDNSGTSYVHTWYNRS